MELKDIKKEGLSEIELAQDLKELDNIFKKYLGKKGELVDVFSSIKKMTKAQKAKLGKDANEAKKALSEKIKEKKNFLAGKSKSPDTKWLDVTIPGLKTETGHLHPLTLVRRNIEEIFQVMGFSIVSGPQIETEHYNFDALNIPKDHPARDLWDTFYLKSGLLLRTHTSPVQVRFMEKHKPPFRIVSPGRIFRHEATDASHETNFYQVEALMIGEDISASNFKAIIEEFLSRFFQKRIDIRLRPSFFPFVEPGFEIDASCAVCGGKGCSTCSQTGWIELMGAGMVHPNVLESAGINSKKWQGFAFGVGMDRLAMMRYKINDVRLLYSGDLRFLKQF